MSRVISRRRFLQSAAAAAALPAIGNAWAQGRRTAPLFRISLAQWSLHRTLKKGELDHLDFARVAKEKFGVEGIEYVNQFFRDKATDAAYLAEMNTRAKDAGVYQHLIMVDGEGQLGNPDAAKRKAAVENHYKWVEAAKVLGCAMIRVNAASAGERDEQQKLAADGLRQLTDFADTHAISVVVENHGGLSSDGQWLSGVMKLVNHPRCGTLPDFGNFYEYDRYQGVADLMPFAKAVSAKSHDFDEKGNESAKDYHRLMKTVTDAGYRSWVGIEYEGDRLSEPEGIMATKRLLERVRSDLAAGKGAQL
jgi:sugar phosphate isomerase/epimerase